MSVAPGFNLGSMCVTGHRTAVLYRQPVVKQLAAPYHLPLAISREQVQECNQTITYSVPALSGVTSYNWTAPIGATVVSGQGTNTVISVTLMDSAMANCV
ncbi:MAG: hypothetical protein IPG39_08000 [Bacteroidetes bacterium]|nr:hypothetical protein [Bacteroidota bacterium]